MAPVATNLRLHSHSLSLFLLDGFAVLFGVWALASGDSGLMLGPVAALGLTFGAAQREVSRCTFSSVLPEYREAPRRVAFRVAAACGLLVAATAVLHGGAGGVAARGLQVLALGTVGSATVLVAAVLAMHYAGMVGFGWVAVGISPEVGTTVVSQPGTVLAAGVVCIAVAWRLLDGGRMARWFAVRPTLSGEVARDPEGTRRYADARAVRHARRTEPSGTALVRLVNSPRVTESEHALAAAVLPTVGRYSIVEIVGTALAVGVAIVLWCAWQQRAMAQAWVAMPYATMVQLWIVEQPRQKVLLPFGRSALLKRHVQRLGLGLVVAFLGLVALDALSRVAAPLAERLGRADFVTTDLRSYWAGVVVCSCSATALVPFARDPFFKGLLTVGSIGFGIAVGPSLRHAGDVASVVACAAVAALSFLLLVAHYGRGDLV